MGSNGAPSAYDVAIAAATTDAERERLKALRLRFNTPPNSPEWQFYAVLAPLFAPTTDRDEQLAGIKAQLDRIEKRNRGGAMRDPTAVLFRDLCGFLAGMLVWIAVAVLASSVRPGYLELICAAALGAGAMVSYLWLAPRVQGAVNSR